MVFESAYKGDAPVAVGLDQVGHAAIHTSVVVDQDTGDAREWDFGANDRQMIPLTEIRHLCLTDKPIQGACPDNQAIDSSGIHQVEDRAGWAVEPTWSA